MTNKIRIGKIDFICIISLWLTYILFSLKVLTYDINFLKNAVMLALLMIMGVCYFYGQKHRKAVFRKEFLMISAMCLTYLVISCLQILLSGRFTFSTFKAIFQVWLPAAIVFLILNILGRSSLELLMKGILGICFSIYMFSNLHNFSLDNLRLINLTDSFSPFESNIFPGVAMGLLIYYVYNRKNRLCLILSGLFVFLTFKRINVVFLLLLLIAVFFTDKDRCLPGIAAWGMKVGTVCGVFIFYENLVHGPYDILGRVFGWNLGNYSMGRNWFLKSLLNSGYESYGYASSIDWIGRDIEMDMIKILFEVTIVGLVATVFVFVDIAERHLYLLLVSCYILIQLMVGHFLDATYSWIVIYLGIGMIKYCGEKNPAVTEQSRSRKKYGFVRMIKVRM